MSVRYALGAKRVRVVQQLLVEGLLLGLAGGVLGIAIAPRLSAWMINMIWSRTSGDLPFSSHPDLRILLFNFSLALLVSLLFSLAPAAQFWRPNLAPALKQQAMTASSGPLRFRRISVAVQIGLSLLVLLGAGLFVRTLHNLKSLNVGIQTDHLVTLGVEATLAGYRPDQTRDLDTRILQTLAALPGVRSVAGTTDPELADNNTSNNITLAGYTAKENEDMNVESPRVSPGYFSTMGMRLVAGREFTGQDRDAAHKVAVVNESFARHYFGEPQLAIGHYYAKGGGSVTPDTEIVGVVKDAKHTGVRQEITRTTFTPYLQETNPRAMTFYVRTWQSPESAEGTIRSAMQNLDSKLVLDTFRTMEEQVDDILTTERVIAILASAFGALAVLMAAVGLYGVLAYSTAQRTREIGIRIALGAARGSVMRMVLAEVLWLAGVSIALALPGFVAPHSCGAQPVVRYFQQRPHNARHCDPAGSRSCTCVGAAASTPRGQDQPHDGLALRIEIQIHGNESEMIQLKNIDRSYKTGAGRTWVLRRVNLEIREGEFITVMGPSGAGKSSLLNALALLDDQWEGEYWFREEAVHSMKRKQRSELAKKNVGMVFQSYHLLDPTSPCRRTSTCLCSYKDISAQSATESGGRHARSLPDCSEERSVSQPAFRGAAATGGDRAGSDPQASAPACR